MNFENQTETFSARMLVTLNGYMLRVDRTIDRTKKEIYCFFVDHMFEHIPWKLTISKGMQLNVHEYNRLKGNVGLKEEAVSPSDLAKAIVITKKLMADPYTGLTDEERSLHPHIPAAPVQSQEKVISPPLPAQKATVKKMIPPSPVQVAKKKKELPAVVTLRQTKNGFKMNSFDELQRLFAVTA